MMDRAAARARLDRLWSRGCALLGAEVAIMGGAMTWVSERNLVAAISNAGGYGVIACGSMSPELLSQEIAATALQVNDRTENIGARRLFTIMERLLEQVSFDGAEATDRHVVINAAYVKDRLQGVVKDQDLSRYIL